jgi:hypothetical protein
MIKESDDVRRTARERAKRKWNNLRIEREFKEGRKETKEKEAKEPKVTYVADVLERNRPNKRGSVLRAQSKFAKFIKEMMNDQSERNLTNYKVALRIQKIKMLKAKMKLLKLMKLKELEDEAQKQQETIAAQQVQNQPVQKPVKKDLFS